MDISQWPKDLGLMKSNMEKVGSSSSSNTSNNSTSSRSLDETRTTKPAKQKSLNCPRCNSKNTKFCYYNNYSLTQPRYFCKTCRRYWTEGGTLRNVPIGGGSRKNKKSTTVSPPSTSISLPNMVSSCNTTSSASKISVDSTNHDLNLAFSPVQPPDFTGTSSITTPFMPIMMNSVPSMSFGMQDLRSNALGCPLDFISGADQGENSEGRLLFPFDEARRMNYTSGHVNGDDDHNQHDHQEQNKLYEHNGRGDRHYFWNDLISGSDD